MNVHSKKREAATVVSRPRGRPRKGGMRERILAAALKVFAERGYHGTSIPSVAAAARAGIGTLYLHFADKQDLVNQVYREAKGRLATALLSGLDPQQPPRQLFTHVWRRLVGFARAEPLAFQFLEMQDHVPYLDAKSRTLELSVLAPIWAAAEQFRAGGAVAAGMPAEAAIALIWGALVGLFKAERLGYLKLTDTTLEQAGRACWAALTTGRRKP